MLNVTDLTETIGTAGTAIAGGVGWAIIEVKRIAKFVKEHELVKKGKELVEAVFWIRDHLQANKAAQETVQLAEQVATSDDGELRLSYIAAAVHLLPAAIGVELDNLKNVPAPVLAKLLNDRVPILRGTITSLEVTKALRLGSVELTALRNHELLPTIRDILSCIEPVTEMEQEATTVEKPA